MTRKARLECSSTAAAAQAVGCDERMLAEIIKAGLVPTIELEGCARVRQAEQDGG